ncbi:MAG: putative DNA-binding domain-containing protein [Methylococcales bacterium]|nr:putative DNA-binding domain-containing protein [Methylococcales bacterium]
MNASLPKHTTGVAFKAKQLEFTAYIKDPFNHKIPEDVKPQRMEIYRELFFNNVVGFLDSNFPVLKALHTEAQWFALTYDFFAKHSSESPYFSDIPEEFISYLQNERHNPDDYPFMLELAHYEWIEMALFIAKETLPEMEKPEKPEKPEKSENLLFQAIQLSPLAVSLAYQYPVHEISPDFLPLDVPAQASYLIVYRNREDEVNFIQTTAVTHRLLQLVDEKSPVVQACLQQIATEMTLSNSESLIKNGVEIIQDLIEKNILFIQKNQ